MGRAQSPKIPTPDRAKPQDPVTTLATPSPGAPSSTTQPQPQPNPSTPPASESLTTGQDYSQRMTAEVFVNGQGPFYFLVDTGANRSGITIELATRLKLPAADPVQVHGIAASVLTPTVNIDDFRVGSFRIPLKGAPTFTRSDLGADGLIGLDLLHDRVVTLKFATNRIEVSRSSFGNVPTMSITGHGFIGAVIPARQRFGQLTILDAEAGDHVRMTCFIDTGADQSVGNEALRTAVQARQKPEDIVSTDVSIHSATGQTVAGHIALMPHMRIGGVEFSQFGLAFADLHTFDLWGLQSRPALLLGMDLLRLFDTVIIDFSQREVTFEKR